MFKFEEILSVEMCENNPSFLFVFGDNLLKKGKKGQAIIRDCKNAFGVPTKRLPSMEKGSFFTDQRDEIDIVKEKLIFLWEEHLSGKTIVLPKNMIGSGLARLNENSPYINGIISRFYNSAKERVHDIEKNEDDSRNNNYSSCTKQSKSLRTKNR